MAKRHDAIPVVVSDAARHALDEIWAWNADRYSAAHAHAYVEFLLSETDKLSHLYSVGRRVLGRPQYQYIIIRRRRGGAGHVVVYEVKDDRVVVLQYFHTAQDWTTQID